ncbi:MAG: heparinase II/III-family protein [Armatimonadetes bacterium]|nr:heparinase II/III-family protein [Armatimonadota bacterium]
MMVGLLALLSTVSAQGPDAGAGGAAGAGLKHPVLNHGIDKTQAAGYEAAVSRVMAMGEEEMLAFVPDRPFCEFCDCPNCHPGSFPAFPLTWTIERPAELKCRLCGTVYPNAQFPDDQLMTGRNALGETVSFPFQVDRQTGIRIFLPAHLTKFRRAWIEQQARALGIAYQATGQEEYARRAILILDRMAQVYPHYPVMVQWITTFEFAPSQQPPYPAIGGKWGRWRGTETPGGIPEAYDLVYDSPQFAQLSQTRGYDVRARIATDFLRATWEHVSTFEDFDNTTPQNLLTVIKMGRVIGEPHYLHWSYHWLRKILYSGFMYDGMWPEAPSYHYYTVSVIAKVAAALKGYTDPPGYVDPLTGRRFDDLDPEVVLPFLQKALYAPDVVGLPNGCFTPVHDTVPGHNRSAYGFPAPGPRQKTVSTILPGYGHASLGRGEGPDQMQAQLHFSGAYGHDHRDSLSLILFAKERELLSDIGYTHTRLRTWPTSTVGHNGVAVDRREQTRSNSDGNLLWFFPDCRGVAAVEADGRPAYANLADLAAYRRLLVQVPVSAADAYVVDLFRVTGGGRHDWLAHGDADRDMTAECDVPLTPRAEGLLEPGETWVEPRDEQSAFNPYGVIREVRQGRTDGELRVTFRYADEPARGVRLHALGTAGTEVLLGRSPSIRRAGNDSRKVFDFWMPQVLLRRAGPAPLQSLFTVIEEPFRGEPFLKVVTALALTPAAPEAVALTVRHGDMTDTIISTLDNPPYPERVTANGIRLRGRLGIVREQGGRVEGAWLLQGEALSGGGWQIKAETSRHEGRIVAATRREDGAEADALVTLADLPTGTVLRGSWMIVTHGNGRTHGYEIDRVERREGRTFIILTGDHGLKVEGETTTEVFRPQRQINGVNTFVIPLATAVRRP